MAFIEHFFALILPRKVLFIYIMNSWWHLYKKKYGVFTPVRPYLIIQCITLLFRCQIHDITFFFQMSLHSVHLYNAHCYPISFVICVAILT